MHNAHTSIAQERKICTHNTCTMHKYLRSNNITICNNRCHRHQETGVYTQERYAHKVLITQTGKDTSPCTS